MVTKLIFAILFLGVASMPGLVKADRSAPQPVAPVSINGVEFRAPLGAKTIGIVEAWDLKTGQKLWEEKIYSIFYNPILEKDVQDVFISNLAIEGDKLIITNEKDKRYSLDPKTRKVMKLN